MKPLQLLITIALVGAGILVYDTFRSAELPLEVLPPREVVRPVAPAPTTGDRPERPPLWGNGLEFLEEWKAELDARVAELEAALQAGGGGKAAEATGPRARTPEAWRPQVLAEGETPHFDPRDVAWFRALDEELLRIRREESEVRSITAQLDRIRRDLPDDTRREIVAATRAFRAEKRDILARSRRDALSLELRQAAFDEARRRYDDAVRRVAPADAEEIVQRFGSYPGRRPGRPFEGNR